MRVAKGIADLSECRKSKSGRLDPCLLRQCLPGCEDFIRTFFWYFCSCIVWLAEEGKGFTPPPSSESSKNVEFRLGDAGDQ